MKKSEQTRRLLLDMGCKLFMENGYDQTSTREIVSACGLASGTLFRHFPTKFDLLYQGLTEQMNEFLAQSPEAQNSDAPKLKLRHYANVLYTFYLSHPQLSHPLFKELLWRKPEFDNYLGWLNGKLFSAHPEYDPVRAAVMTDCFVMTLVQGMQTPGACARDLVRELSNKLTKI